MARYPGAKWRPVTGHTDGPMNSYRGAVLHVNESNGNLYNWVAGDHDMSCHFEVYKDGTIEQYLDTGMTSWCQMAGNADWISIETEGFHTEALTDAQVQAVAGLMTWLHTTHGIPLQITNAPTGRGFGWHGMGGAAWGGHTDCPGDQRKAQRQQILDLTQGDDMPLSDADLTKIGNLIAARISQALTGDDGQPHQLRTIIDQELQPKLDAAVNKIIGALGRITHDSDHKHPEALVHIEAAVKAIAAKVGATVKS